MKSFNASMELARELILLDRCARFHKSVESARDDEVSIDVALSQLLEESDLQQSLSLVNDIDFICFLVELDDSVELCVVEHLLDMLVRVALEQIWQELIP